jgi:hypothetical protein
MMAYTFKSVVQSTLRWIMFIYMLCYPVPSNLPLHSSLNGTANNCLSVNHMLPLSTSKIMSNAQLNVGWKVMFLKNAASV